MEIDNCSVCHKDIIKEENSISTGYGINDKNEKVCYACCGEQDKKQLLKTGILSGYFTKSGLMYKFGNWPSSFVVNISWFKHSYHNFAGRNGRTDFWFRLENQNFHGVHIGHNNECATVRRVK